MAVAITLSSGSDSDSDVEIVGFYSNRNQTLPLTTVQVEVGALDVRTSLPLINVDLTNPSWASADLDIYSRLVPSPQAVVDLTEYNERREDQGNLFHLPSNGTDKGQLSLTTDLKSLDGSGDSSIGCETTNVYVERKPEKTQLIKKLSYHRSASVVLKRLPILENNLSALLTLDTAFVVKTGHKMSLYQKKCDRDLPTDCTDLLNTTTCQRSQPSVEIPHSSSGLSTASDQTIPLAHGNRSDYTQQKNQISKHTLTQSTHECLSIPSPGCASAAFQQNILSKERRVCSPPPPVGTFTVQPAFTESTDCSLASTSHTDEKTVAQLEGLAVTELPESLCDNRMSKSHSLPPESVPSISATIYSDKEYYQFDYSPVSFSGEESTDYHTSNFEAELDNDSTSPAQDDKYYVCPAAVKRLMHGVDVLTEVSMEHQQMLGPLSLSLVYSTIEEGYTEGTLQLLSDLLQPDVYPPKEITHHLLKEILLCPQSPHHHCARAFSLLMRIQRHHIVDTLSVSWDWEMLSSAIENEELCPESLHMFLEYVVRTLEDDLRTKQSTSAHNQSIVKAVLSFNQQFPHIKDTCKWLFSAIVKSTDGHDIKGDHSRMVNLFQKMLSLALEVDGSPTISSVKLSHELFHILINKVQLRPQRMLLLESLQSKRLRCKLLEHLLDYSCPVKTSVPMSLSLMLHFLKNCTLSPDPFDGTEKWRRWEELIHHLWMLLLSYNSTVKEYTSGCKTENKVRVDTQIHKPDDVLSKRAVHEAVEAFLSRSQDDVGGTLPLHVEESLTYLQDHLMDACQC